MRRTSVATLVVVALVAVVTLFMIAVGAAGYARERERRWSLLRQDLRTEADQLAISLVLPVWNFDRPQIERILDALDTDRDLEAVVVEAGGRSHARVRDASRHFVPAAAIVASPVLLQEERTVRAGGDAIGTLRLYATSRFVEEDLRGSLMAMASTIVAVDLLTVLSLSLVLWRIVLKPLRDIERYALAVGPAGVSSPTSMRGAVFLGELAGVRSAIETMVGLLDRRYEELRQEVVRRWESEQAAQESAEEYRNIVDFAPVGILRDSREGTVITANTAFARLLGYERAEEVLGRDGREFFCDRGERDRMLARYEGAGVATRVEARLQRRDGTPFWAEVSSHLVKDDEGRLLYIESFVEDVSERRAAVEALRSSEERYRLLFEGNPLPMVVWDLETLGFVAANEAAVAQYGYSRDGLLALTLPDLSPPDDEYLAPFLASRFDPRPALVRVGVHRQRRRDGHVLEVDLTSLALTIGGRPMRLMVARDVTAERRAAAERDALQESLRRSETMSALGSLVAGVAHEVRNPLFSITATVDAIESELGGRPEYAELTTLLRSQVRRLTQLMRDLLDYGSPPALRRTPVRLGEILTRARRACSALAGERAVKVVEDVSADVPQVSLDAERMEQVVQNLLANAIQHSPPGGTVRMVARRSAAADGPLELSVEDEGAGVAPEDLPRLFEPFFSRRKGGTGLGLSVVQRIVEAHGGRITVANRAAGGAVFTLLLPAALVEGTKTRAAGRRRAGA